MLLSPAVMAMQPGSRGLPASLRGIALAYLLGGPTLSGSTAVCEVSAYYDGVDFAAAASALKTTLHSAISPHNVIPYTSTAVDVWDALKVLDAHPDDSSQVKLIYTQQGMAADLSGVATGWNREHLWPKSYGVGYEGPDFSDLHCLRAADWNVNSARNNLYFDNCDPATHSDCSSPAHSEAAADTAKNELSFMPPVAVRGDIARCMFYMVLRYDGTETNTYDLQLTNCPCSTRYALGKLATLLQWHAEDPVDEAERARNERICSDYQNNRNPFVDHPEIVAKLWPADFSDGLCSMDCPAAPSGGGDEEEVERGKGPCVSPGDVAIVGFNSDGIDTIGLVALSPLPAGAQISVTDNAWTGSEWRATEGIAVFTVGADAVPAGSVLAWKADGSSSGAGGTWATEGVSPSLTATGEALLVYQQCEGKSEPNFVFGLDFSPSGWAAAGDVLTSTNSLAPPALVSAGLALALPHKDNYVYSGSTSGTRAALIGNITQVAGWTGDNTQEMVLPAGPFVEAVAPDGSGGGQCRRLTVEQQRSIQAKGFSPVLCSR